VTEREDGEDNRTDEEYPWGLPMRLLRRIYVPAIILMLAAWVILSAISKHRRAAIEHARTRDVVAEVPLDATSTRPVTIRPMTETERTNIEPAPDFARDAVQAMLQAGGTLRYARRSPDGDAFVAQFTRQSTMTVYRDGAPKRAEACFLWSKGPAEAAEQAQRNWAMTVEVAAAVLAAGEREAFKVWCSEQLARDREKGEALPSPATAERRFGADTVRFQNSASGEDTLTVVTVARAGETAKPR